MGQQNDTPPMAASSAQELRKSVIGVIRDVMDEQSVPSRGELDDSVVLLQTGLDSLAFAIVVAKLEDLLGYDPFVLMSEPIYPRTLGEFISLYVKMHPGSTSRG